MEKQSDIQEVSFLIKRARSFVYAGRGIVLFFKTTHNAWVQAVLFLLAILLGIYFGINRTEWTMLVLSGGFVLVSEAFNTAFEIDINLTSPEYHPYARDTKDVAAGAVLISVIVAVIVGGFVFVPYLV